MSDLLHDRPPSRTDQPPELTTADLPLLTRLNRRGFRLVQLADLTVLAAILVGSMVVRFGGWDWPTYPLPLYALSFTVTLGIFMAAVYFGGLYERAPRLGSPPVLPVAARQTLAAGGLVALLNLAATGVARDLGFVTERALPIPTPNLIVLIVLGAVGIAANRQLTRLIRVHNEGIPRLLLVGSPEDLETAREHLDVAGSNVEIAGATSTAGGDLLAEADEIGATDVLLLSGSLLDTVPSATINAFEEQGRMVLQRVGVRETMFGLERVREIGGMPFVLLRTHTLAASRAHFKRLTDVVALVVLAPVWLPLLAAVALYQLVAAGRPILFRQTRVGAGGRPFEMVKFRTMVPDAEEDGAPRLATREDPRIIDACRWLRAMRLDELPQIYNVLKGEMSLVGPRPERPELTDSFEDMIPGYDRRHEIPPGLTGLAQIHGHYHTDAEYKLGYDLQYLVNWSPVLDLEILLRTAWVVLTRRV